MSGPNHIVGGAVFTGIYLSMFDINILSKPMYLGMTAFFAILADVDHTKTPIGKCFYPISKYLDRKFGHRTLTHSLLFYFTGAILVGIIETLVNGRSGVFTQIFLWAYGSHLIFDMLTKQGVPLFYPFKKSPCVIPANPDFRFRSSCLKTEAMIFVIFVGLAFSCQPLFANGFWNTYNRTFDNVKHVFAETLKTPNLIEVDYNVTTNGKQKEGTAEVLEASQGELFVYNQKQGFFKITSTDFITKLNPIRTAKTLIKKELSFNDISMDSLRNLISRKIIVDLKIQGVLPIYYVEDNQPKSSTSIALKYVVNPTFRSDRIDSLDLAAEKEIQEIELQTQMQNEEYGEFVDKKNEAIKELQKVQVDLLSEDLSIRESAVHLLSQKEAAVKAVERPFRNTVSLLMLRKKYLLKRLHIHKEQTITGYISYFQII